MVVIECGEFDKYGRLLGKIYLKQDKDGQSGGGESVSINDWLIQNKVGNMDKFPIKMLFFLS